MNVTYVTTLVNMILNGETANLELADINADGKVKDGVDGRQYQ